MRVRTNQLSYQSDHTMYTHVVQYICSRR